MLKTNKKKKKIENLTQIFNINLNNFAIVERVTTIITIALKKKRKRVLQKQRSNF